MGMSRGRPGGKRGGSRNGRCQPGPRAVIRVRSNPAVNALGSYQFSSSTLAATHDIFGEHHAESVPVTSIFFLGIQDPRTEWGAVIPWRCYPGPFGKNRGLRPSSAMIFPAYPDARLPQD